MSKLILSVVILVGLLPFNALSKEPVNNYQFHTKGLPEKSVDPSTGEIGLAKALKNIKLPNYKSKTFGEAVDGYRYFVKREWKETHSSYGKVYVDFTGWLKNRPFDVSTVSARGIGIKFLVKPDGNYAVVMVSKIEIRTDGNLLSVPINDISVILNNLYNNVEFNL